MLWQEYLWGYGPGFYFLVTPVTFNPQNVTKVSTITERQAHGNYKSTIHPSPQLINHQSDLLGHKISNPVKAKAINIMPQRKRHITSNKKLLLVSNRALICTLATIKVKLGSGSTCSFFRLCQAVDISKRRYASSQYSSLHQNYHLLLWPSHLPEPTTHDVFCPGIKSSRRCWQTSNGCFLLLFKAYHWESSLNNQFNNKFCVYSILICWLFYLLIRNIQSKPWAMS